MDGQGTKRRRKIAENFNRLSRAHQRYRRQTDRRAIAYITNVNVRSRSLKTAFFGRCWCTKCASPAYVYKVTWLTKLPPVSVHVISISCSAHWGVPVWYFSGRKCRYDLYSSREVPVWHTVSYRPTSSTEWGWANPPFLTVMKQLFHFGDVSCQNKFFLFEFVEHLCLRNPDTAHAASLTLFLVSLLFTRSTCNTRVIARQFCLCSCCPTME